MSASSIKINIGKQFSRFPAGRYIADGPGSGEQFREQILIPALRSSGVVEIELDDALGYGSSFLEEAFGGVVRSGSFGAKDLHAKLCLLSEDDSLVREVWEYIDEAAR